MHPYYMYLNLELIQPLVEELCTFSDFGLGSLVAKPRIRLD
jgi:hypothetical protein